MQLDLEISKISLAWALSRMHYDELRGLIQEVDLMVADVGFTEDLIKVLVHSLKADKEDTTLPFINWDRVE